MNEQQKRAPARRSSAQRPRPRPKARCAPRPRPSAPSRGDPSRGRPACVSTHSPLAPYAHDDLWALADVGYQYLRNGAHGIAEVIFSGLVSIDPAEVYHRIALGCVFETAGDLARAEDAYREACRLDPESPHAHLNLAEVMLERRRTRDAVAHLERAERAAHRRRDLAVWNRAQALRALHARATEAAR